MTLFRITLHVVSSALVLACGLRAAEFRPWTDVDQRTIEARMLSLDGDSVMLELKDGRKVPVPLARLSPADAEHARNAAGGAQAAADGGVEEPNFTSEWPERIKFTEDPEIRVVEEDAEAKNFVYESANYRYLCDVRLSSTIVKGFAVMFEATYLYCRALPLGLDGGDRREGKLIVRLFENFHNFVNAGGSPTSGGIYQSSTGEVLVPFSSLGVRPMGSGYTLDRNKTSKTLPHELAHQLTHLSYLAGPTKGWFTEGIAQYVEMTPYRAGTFTVRGNIDHFIAHVTAFGKDHKGGRNLGRNIKLPRLREFMLQPYEAFLANPAVNYGSALLITCYFMHMDGEGDAKRLKAMLKAIRDGQDEEQALKALLDGRSFDELEKELSKAWRRKGVEFTFG
jgi:hypothetical protein